MHLRSQQRLRALRNENPMLLRCGVKIMRTMVTTIVLPTYEYHSVVNSLYSASRNGIESPRDQSKYTIYTSKPVLMKAINDMLNTAAHISSGLL